MNSYPINPESGDSYVTTKRNRIAYNLQDSVNGFIYVSAGVGALAVSFLLLILMTGNAEAIARFAPIIFIPLGIYAFGRILHFIGFLLETEERELFFP